VTSRWPILALVTLAHALGALTALAVAPLAPFLLESLELSRVQIGLFLPAIYLGGVLMALPAGWFTDRLGVRFTFALGQLLVGAMIMLAAWSPSFGLLLFLLMLGGFGFSVLNPATGRAVVEWFPPRERGIAMGVKQTGLTLGGLTAALLLPPIAREWSWRHALGTAGLLSLVSAALETLLPPGSLVSPQTPVLTPRGDRLLLCCPGREAGQYLCEVLAVSGDGRRNPGDRAGVARLVPFLGSAHQRLAHGYQQLRDAYAVVKGLPMPRLPVRSEDRAFVTATSPGRGRSDASPVTRAAGVCRVNRARRSSGPVRIRALAWPFVRVRSPAAPRRATISARIASTAPSRPFGAPRARPDCAARAALTASSGPGLALPAPVLPVRADCPDHPDASSGDMAGQSGAVAAGPFDTGQGDGPEPAQPARQPGIAGRRGRELPDAGQPANGIERGRDVHVGVSVYPACDDACFSACLYDGQCRPFLWSGMARTRWPSDL